MSEDDLTTDPDEKGSAPAEPASEGDGAAAVASPAPEAEAPPESEAAPEADDVPEAEAERDAAAAEHAGDRDAARGGDAGRAAKAPARAGARGRRRDGRDPSLPTPVVRAQARYVRSSARKARLVCDNIRGKSVQEARAILALTPRAVARDWSKLLESAVANAEHNHELVGEDLYVKAVHADEGPTIKRFRPRAMGRATKIRKRTSHLTILLTPKD